MNRLAAGCYYISKTLNLVGKYFGELRLIEIVQITPLTVSMCTDVGYYNGNMKLGTILLFNDHSCTLNDASVINRA